MKETRLKRPNTVGFHLYDIPEKTNHRERQQIISHQGLRWGEELTTKEQLKGLLGAGTVLYLNFGSCTALCVCQNSCTKRKTNISLLTHQIGKNLKI